MGRARIPTQAPLFSWSVCQVLYLCLSNWILHLRASPVLRRRRMDQWAKQHFQNLWGLSISSSRVGLDQGRTLPSDYQEVFSSGFCSSFPLPSRQGLTFVWKAISRTANRRIRDGCGQPTFHVHTSCHLWVFNHGHISHKNRSENLREERKACGKEGRRKEGGRQEEMEGNPLFRGACWDQCTGNSLSWPFPFHPSPWEVRSDYTCSLGFSQRPGSLGKDFLAIPKHRYLDVLERVFQCWLGKRAADWDTMIP